MKLTHKKYLKSLVLLALIHITTGCSSGKDLLTVEERLWLSAHDGRIKYAPLPNYSPIDFVTGKGVHQGVTADYIRLIENRLGFHFKKVYLSSWSEILTKAESGEIDVMGSIQDVPQRHHFFNFTRPYITIPNAIITRELGGQSLTLDQMNGMKTAVVAKYATIDFIKKNNPGVIVEQVKDDVAGLQKVSVGEVDAMITDLSVASYYISQLGITNLRVVGTIDFTWHLCLGARKDTPILVKILQKGLDTIDEGERREIHKKWIVFSGDLSLNKRIIWAIAATLFCMLLIVGIVLSWNRMLKRHVHDRTAQLRKELEERHRAEAALQKSEEQFRTLVLNIPGVVYRWNHKLANKWIFVSDEIEHITGYRATDFTRSNAKSFMEFIHRDDKESATLQIEHAIKEKRPYSIVFRIIHKDGNIRWISENGRGVYGDDGELAWIDGTLFDITDRVQAQEEKEVLKRRLVQAEKMETIGTLAGGVAHDLNNILGAIIGYPDLLLHDLPATSPLKEPIQAIQESGERAMLVVQDLLALARRGVLVNEVVNINNVITSYIQSRECKKLLEDNPSVVIDTILEPSLLNILGSPFHLTKILMNLISNSVEAISGDGQITVSTGNRYLDQPVPGYDIVTEGEYVLVTLTDTGAGIAEDDLTRIFEPFYTKKKMGRSGTGLGMSVVWGTVKDHNGYIDVESAENKGTTFRIYFPVTRQPFAIKEDEDSIESIAGNGEKILIVDDIASQRQLASRLLTQLNYHVDSVESGEQAVEYVKKTPVDLLLLDMIMEPGIDGLETYKKIIAFRPSQKAVIASGFSITDRITQAQSLGAGEYVKKPYTIRKLGTAVKAELSK